MRHPAENLLLLQVLGHRHLDGPVERQLALVDLLQDIDDQGQGEVAFEDLAAEPLAGDLDLLGQADLLVAGQERDLAHLGQVHPDRVVDPPRDLIEVFDGQFAVVVVDRLIDEFIGLVIGVTRGEEARLGLVLVDQLDAQLVERLEQAVDLLGTTRLIGQVVVHLIEGQESTTLAQVEERLEALVQLVHPESSLGTTGQDAFFVFVSGRCEESRDSSSCKARYSSGLVAEFVCFERIAHIAEPLSAIRVRRDRPEHP